ncbi:16S rRNA (guanine(527)-N(7))-methyltransferase RsmG [Desulfogranum mediterraneum]|uniref:16S rRNA (guanine(527)-N(7))-methyltransferase RsmG n=1 Tax=Desulfogranum mediterraneum TaxID=160661 RepID=UPI000418F543|nr:16S rRNA (guanine(527)-N(7))-methyltransferase RsmG [Desulfogranum mediterraneum]
MESRELLRSGAASLGVELGDEELERLLIYLGELIKWSRRINLIARDSDPATIIENHFLDSLTLVSLVDRPGLTLLDVGSGAGFPGLVLAAVLPALECTLVEPRKKRVSFLNHIIRTLGLGNVRVVADRVETLAEPAAGPYSFVTSRAVASPELFLPLVERFLRQGSRALVMAAHRERLAEIPTGEGHFRLEQVKEIRLPVSRAPRLVALVSACQGQPAEAS